VLLSFSRMASAAFYSIAGYSARMSRRPVAVTGALLIALLVPAAAEAAEIQPLKPCYVTANTPSGPQQEGVAISASGFTPNSTVDLAIDGASVGTALQTDASGLLNLSASQVKAPFIPEGSRQFTVTLTETTNPANTVSTTSMTTALGVDVKPRQARPSRRIRFKGSGFTGDKPVYAHYVYRNKLRKTVRMARKTTDCGDWTSHRRQIPVDDPGQGNWIVQFDQSKKFRDARKPNSGLKSVFVLIRITVSLVPQG
jgi:hypothetical protein